MAEFFAGKPIDGICGLGFKALSRGSTPPFINAIDRDLVEPLFTVWIEKKGGNVNGVAGGLIVYGEEFVDNSNCGPIIKYVQLSQAAYWQFTLNAYSFDKDVSRNDQRWQVISDTGTSFIGIPKDVLYNLIHYTNAKVDRNYGYVVRCDIKVTLNLELDGIKLEITQDYLVRKDGGICSLAVFEMNMSGEIGWILGRL